MTYIFWGGKEIGSYVLQNLIQDGILPAGIVSYQQIIDASVLDLAREKQIPVLQVDRFKKSLPQIEQFVKDSGADSFVSVSFPFILPGSILRLVKTPVNIHTGAIPRYRGYHPISAALLNDEPYQGTTVHLMAEEVDAGDVLLQDFVPVKNTDTINTVKGALIQLSYRLLRKVLDQIANGTLYPKKQVGEVIWAPKRGPEDSRIDFSQPSRYLHNFIRALETPYPNAFGFVNGERIHVRSSMSGNTPGEVIACTTDGRYVVATGDGVVIIETDRTLKIGDRISSTQE